MFWYVLQVPVLTMLTINTSRNLAILLLLVILCVEGANDTANCRIPADPDILGLGVRLGLYFQLFSSGIVVIVRPAESLGSIAVSNMLSGGIFIAVWHSTWTSKPPPGAILTVTTLLLLDILLAIPILVFVWDMHPKMKLSYWTATFCILRWTGAIGFGLWFWFKGLNIVTTVQCMEPQTCIYKCSGAYGKSRKYQQANFIIGAIIAFAVWIAWIAFGIYCAFFRPGKFEERWSMSRPFRNRLTAKRIRDWFTEYHPVIWWCFAIIISMLFVFGLCTFISIIEMQIKHNHLDGVGGIDTTGQIVPLAVGCLSLSRALMLVVLWILGVIEPETVESNISQKEQEMEKQHLTKHQRSRREWGAEILNEKSQSRIARKVKTVEPMPPARFKRDSHAA